MRRPIVVISNDWHLAESNLEVIPGLVLQEIELAKRLEITTLVGLGDFFQERKAQKEAVLNTFKKCLDLIHENGMKLIAIPGNHDKTNYSSYSSFLDPFSSHPALVLIRECTEIEIGRVKCCFIPFFEDSLWLEEFKKLPLTCEVLFSHTAVNGSVNNNKTKVESSITPALFKKIKQVFLGHYHDAHSPAVNIHHLPSLQQNNFGENKIKGFTVLYENLETETVISDFLSYETIQIDAPLLTTSKIKEIISSFSPEKGFLRLKILGQSNIIKSLDLEEMKRVGIKVVPIMTDVGTQGEAIVKVDYSDSDSLLEVFGTFCKENDLSFEIGVSYIKSVI